MDYPANFRERLSELMTDAKLTAERLGEKIGVVESAVSNWKTNRNTVSLPHALALADYFQCSLDFLFGRSEKQLDFMPQPALPFYQQLRAVMQKRNISRYRLCLDLNMSNGNFTQWKRGVIPKMPTFIAIADYLDVTLDYLIGREK